MKFSLQTVAAALAVFAGSVAAQDAPIRLDAEHNATSLQGTWASGSQQVVTGPVRSPSLACSR
jgi:hypothetical protein